MRNFFLLATLFASALATDPNSCSNGANANQNEANTVRVMVGSENGTLRYFPDDIQANVGDVVQFEFMPKNHTVTESAFASPCVPLDTTAANSTRAMIRSGFQPNNGSSELIPAFRIMITDTKPIWLFCAQKMPKSHCQNGMVMVINQNRNDTTDKTLANYRAKAMAFSDTGSSSTSAAVSSSTTTATTVAVTPAAQTTTSASGPSLSASTTGSATSAAVSVFTGAAAPTGSPHRLAALGGLAVVAAAML